MRRHFPSTRNETDAAQRLFEAENHHAFASKQVFLALSYRFPLSCIKQNTRNNLNVCKKYI